ncbi:MAG TPA: extracellular solute-binding protein, partial [Methylomirabilota bacterium]
MRDSTHRPASHPFPLSRRTFLAGAATVSAAAGLEGVLAARRAPAFAQGTKLHIVRWVDFIPEADVELKRQAPEASKALGAEVQFEFINANDLQPRITAAVQSGSGADIIQMLWNWPQLYQNALVDVSDVAEPIGKAQGGYYDVFTSTAKVGGKWLAVPHGTGGNAVAYRRSWHNEIGVREFPKTWDEWREVGKKLKAKGKPVGQALGHSFGDPPTFAYPFLWDFGGAEVDQSGKKVVINSKATLESVKFLQAFWKDACDEGGAAWDDTNNNRAFHAGEISATLNGASIYIVAKRQKDKLKDEKGEPLFQDIEHAALLPRGPAGQFAL